MALKAHLASKSGAPVSAVPLSEADQIEARRQRRRTLLLETSGVLENSGVEANVTIHNLSAAGLLLETDLALGVGEVLAVALPNVGPVGAEVVWESGHLFGCAFQQALGEAALAAAQLSGATPQSGGARTSAKPQADPQATGFGQNSADSLGVRLNRLRRERGMTLAQVAAKLGVSKPTVWAWEKGKARPLAERITAIAKVLGVNESDLNEASSNRGAAELVEDCKVRIAQAYGTNAKNIRVMIEV